jgi:hypothetical protein
MSGYCPNVGELDFEGELGASPKKKKKKKVGGKLKKAFKKVGKGLAVVSTGGLAAVAMTKAGKKVIGKVKKSKAGKAIAKAGKALGIKAKAKVKAKLKPKAAPKRLAPSPKISKPAAKTLKKVMTKTAADCGSKDELASLVAAQLAASLGPKLDSANALLAQFDLQRQATYEHQKLMTDSDFRRQVLSKLALGAANGNDACQKTIRVIMAGRA